MIPEFISSDEYYKIVRHMYRANRYCKYLSQSELDTRFHDIFINIPDLDFNGKLSTLPTQADRNKWILLFTHVLEEFVIRHGPFPAGIDTYLLKQEPLFNPVAELWEKASLALSNKGLQANEVFIKFGQAEYMKNLVEYGEIRIQPASYYAASNHNGAIHDDELSFHVSLALSTEDVLALVANPQDAPSGPLDQRFDITYKSTDYWLYCVTTAVKPRLFVDFGANSCVIIKDVEQFQKRLMLQHSAYFSNTNDYHGKAVYIDPLIPSRGIDIPISKHFRYTYQNEYRFVWQPKTPMEKLNHIDLELGSLKDIAELVTL